ncbi:S26 family signal peptidase [uncultured Amnibacterium sp.]|uniref:S26 family signal peptidase n=1 Tax=uncultured Amnibacterium sp. TaxID=1631851 RepID=UPI0035C9A4FA
MAETMPIRVIAPAAVRPLTILRHHRRELLAIAAAGLIVAVLGIAWAAGLRAFIVESPSMGRAAPVGSLVVGDADAPVQVGDLITFQPPGTLVAPYTHRVVARGPSGFRTKGDINGRADPWTVTPAMVVSRATAVVPGVGWLVRAAPYLLVALVAAQLLGLLIRSPAVRWSVRTAMVSIGLAAVSWTLKPFTGYVLLQSSAEDDGMRATVVSTALLPLRLATSDGRHIELATGEVGHLLMPRLAGGRVTMTAQLGLDPFGWVVVALLCLLPVILVLVLGVPVEEAEDAAV